VEKSGLEYQSQVLKALTLWPPDNAISVSYNHLSIATVWSWLVFIFTTPDLICHLVKDLKGYPLQLLSSPVPSQEERDTLRSHLSVIGRNSNWIPVVKYWHRLLISKSERTTFVFLVLGAGCRRKVLFTGGVNQDIEKQRLKKILSHS